MGAAPGTRVGHGSREQAHTAAGPAPLHTPTPAAGTRALPYCILTIFAPLPPAATLVGQLLMTAVNHAPLAYCKTPLLSDPLSLQRQAAAAAALDAVCLPLACLTPVPALTHAALVSGAPRRGAGTECAAPGTCSGAGRSGAHAALLRCWPPAGMLSAGPTCRPTVAFLHLLVGFAIPLLHSVYTWRPELAQSSAQVGQGSSSLRSLAARASLLANTSVYRLLAGGSGPLVRIAALYYVLGNAWLLCRV